MGAKNGQLDMPEKENEKEGFVDVTGDEGWGCGRQI